MSKFTLNQLRQGLNAIKDRLDKEIWAGTDAVFYGGLKEVGYHRDRRNDMHRIIEAFPKELWEALEKEDRLAKAADLRAKAAALEAEASVLSPAPETRDDTRDGDGMFSARVGVGQNGA